jgi:hypothetical protein
MTAPVNHRFPSHLDTESLPITPYDLGNAARIVSGEIFGRGSHLVGPLVPIGPLVPDRARNQGPVLQQASHSFAALTRVGWCRLRPVFAKLPEGGTASGLLTGYVETLTKPPDGSESHPT